MFPTNSVSSVQSKRINGEVHSNLVKSGQIWMTAHESVSVADFAVFFSPAETTRPFISCQLQEGPHSHLKDFTKFHWYRVLRSLRYWWDESAARSLILMWVEFAMKYKLAVIRSKPVQVTRNLCCTQLHPTSIVFSGSPIYFKFQLKSILSF